MPLPRSEQPETPAPDACEIHRAGVLHRVAQCCFAGLSAAGSRARG